MIRIKSASLNRTAQSPNSKFKPKEPQTASIPFNHNRNISSQVVMNLLKLDFEDQQGSLQISKSPDPHKISEIKQTKQQESIKEIKKLKEAQNEQKVSFEKQVISLKDEIMQLKRKVKDQANLNDKQLQEKQKQIKDLKKQLQTQQDQLINQEQKFQKVQEDNIELVKLSEERDLQLQSLRRQIATITDQLQQTNTQLVLEGYEEEILQIRFDGQKRYIKCLKQEAELVKLRKDIEDLVSQNRVHEEIKVQNEKNTHNLNELAQVLKRELEKNDQNTQVMKKQFVQRIEILNENHQTEIASLKQRIQDLIEKQNEINQNKSVQIENIPNNQQVQIMNFWKEKYNALETSFRSEIMKIQHNKNNQDQIELLNSKMDHQQQIIIFLKQENKELRQNIEQIEQQNYELRNKHNQANERLKFFQKKMEISLYQTLDCWVKLELQQLQKSLDNLIKEDPSKLTKEELKNLLVISKKELIYIYEILTTQNQSEEKMLDIKSFANVSNGCSTISSIENQNSKHFNQGSNYSSSQSNVL